MSRVWVLGMVCWALAVPLAARGQGTPYVPLGERAYADLDALVDAGWVRAALLGDRPYSRLRVARLVAEARTRLAEDSPRDPPARLAEALTRLESAFAAELELLCVGAPACAPPVGGARLRSVSTDATWADSPARAIPTSYDWVDSDYIDADVNPLLQRNQGRVLADGTTVGVEALLDVGLGRRFAGQLSPRVWALDARGQGGDASVTLLAGYVRGVFGSFAVDVGRNHVALGHGRQAGPMLSFNARGLDQLRVSLERPARLPWKLRALGPFTLSALIADMGGSSDTPHSKLIVFDGVLRPSRFVELTAALLNHQGGEGAPPGTLVERLEDIFLIYPQGKSLSDKVVGAGVAVSVPAAHARLYADVTSTDDHVLFTNPDEALSDEAAWTVGARVSGLGRESRLDLWTEASIGGVRAHTHHEFTSGLTMDRRVIGDPVGPLGHSIALGMDWTGRVHTLGLITARERYNNADLYQQIPGDGRFEWDRVEDEPDEIRERLMVAWTRDAGPRRIATGLRAGVERVTQFRFEETRRLNGLVQLRLDYRW